MIAFYCTIPHANSVPLPPRLNISLRYNFLSRLYHFRVLLRSRKKKGKEICSNNFKKILETNSIRIEPQEENLSKREEPRKNRIYILVGILISNLLKRIKKIDLHAKKKLFALVQLCIIYSRENRDCGKQRARRNNSIVQIVDRVIIPDNCTAL